MDALSRTQLCGYIGHSTMREIVMPTFALLNRFIIGILIVFFFSGSLLICSANAGAKKVSLATRIQRLEDCEEIRQLLNDYGKYLDKRDFAPFSQLFAEKDGEWIGGMGSAKGSAAIRKFMEEKIGINAGLPNLHLFMNEIIDVNGNLANAVTKWIFVMQGDAKRPQMVYIGHYQDMLIRENGRWKFLKRQVISDIPPDDTIRGVEGSGCKEDECK
jgi:hypothetical protein